MHRMSFLFWALPLVVAKFQEEFFNGVKFLKAHNFPVQTKTGEFNNIANEFQMIHPESMSTELNPAYSITSVSPLIISNDEMVTISFQTTGKTATTDFIGAYSPANVDITTTVPVKYGFCDESPTYLTNGTGFLLFNLTNLRADVAFYYFTGGTSKSVAVAVSSQNVTFKNFNEPLRPRIIPSGDPNIFKLLWSSATSQRPIARYGFAPGVYDHTSDASTSTFTREQMCGAPANTVGWRDPGLIHTAELIGLEAHATETVYYMFGDDATGDFSEEYSFVLPPLAGQQPPNRPTTVVLFDDLGRGSKDMAYTWNEYGRASINTTYSLGHLVRQGGIDAIYHGGDISYATGYIAVWDFYADQISNFASRAAYFTTLGNHEIDWTTGQSYYNGTDSGGECGVPTLALYPEPTLGPDPWWSYDIGLIHFVGMNTEFNYTIGSSQWAWLEKDLASVDRKKTPWVIFGGHRAMYLNSYYSGTYNFGGDGDVMATLIENIEPLLYKYKVDIAFWGHNHVVQRQSAVYQSKVVEKSVDALDADGNAVHKYNEPKATVHVVIGTGGADFTKTADNSTDYPMPDWNEDFFYLWGYTVVKSVNSTYLTWEWFDSATDKRMEYIVVTRSESIKPWGV